MTHFARAAAFVVALLHASSAWSAATVPSIEITGINVNSGGCATPGVSVDVNYNLPVSVADSENYEIYNGATLLYRWTGENSFRSVGTGTYGVTGATTALPANTTVTGIIYTFSTSTLPTPPYNVFSYRSQIQWNCTTGAVIGITNTIGGANASANPIPMLQPAALAVLVVLLGGGAWLFRRRC